MHNAIYNKGHIDIVKLLLEKGADFNLKDICVHTPLHWAAFNGHIEIVKLLLLINLIKLDGSRLHISDDEIKSFRLFDRLNKLVNFNVEKFKYSIKYLIDKNFKCTDDIKNDRDKLEILLYR